MPVHDDRLLFEFLILEGAQAGLSWITILKKREAYRKAFDQFDPEIVAKYGKRKQQALLSDEGIVRNRLKIESAIKNARAVLDLQQQYGSFSAYLWDQAVTAIATIRAPVILGYLIHLRNRGLSSKSRARHLVTLRGFFRFLHQEKMIPVDPVALIAMPKSGLHLPGILSVPEIRALLSAPDESRPVGLRDAAMLELLYATGLRVSELVNLKLQDINLEAGFVRVFGKGSKERIVPIGMIARERIDNYIKTARPRLLKNVASQYLFDRPLNALRADEIALLVGMVKGPSYYDPRRRPERARKRRDLVLDLLSYSKEREPEFEPCRPNAIAADVCELLQQRARENDIAIVQELDRGNGDRGRVSVVHTSQVVGMHERPLDAVRQKRDSSICRMLRKAHVKPG